ncbi:MAG TPA: TolC family protein, partial [Patescibacteria group bacterium]|nr:TolC family protein [Patescibacteria group bacterium]
MISYKYIGIALIALSPIVCFRNVLAQSSGAQPSIYSLQDALRIGASRNLDIQLANAQMQNAAASVTGAFGTFLPSINFSSGYTRQLFQDEFTTVNYGGIVRQIPTGNPNNYNMSAVA